MPKMDGVCGSLPSNVCEMFATASQTFKDSRNSSMGEI